jgi:hypothetical protein
MAKVFCGETLFNGVFRAMPDPLDDGIAAAADTLVQ